MIVGALYLSLAHALAHIDKVEDGSSGAVTTALTACIASEKAG
jgi:hypothetical protein